VVGGRYLESAAYNPSFGPLQCAVVSATINGMVAHSEVRVHVSCCLQHLACVISGRGG
jgi:hypothetical protein